MNRHIVPGLPVLGLLLLLACVQTVSLSSEQPPPQPAQQHAEVDFSQSCSECHAIITPDVYEIWQASTHGQVNVKCYVCHGDGQEMFYPAGNDSRCSGCHSVQEVDFSGAPVDRCFDCHHGHSLTFHR